MLCGLINWPTKFNSADKYFLRASSPNWPQSAPALSQTRCRARRSRYVSASSFLAPAVTCVGDRDVQWSVSWANNAVGSDRVLADASTFRRLKVDWQRNAKGTMQRIRFWTRVLSTKNAILLCGSSLLGNTVRVVNGCPPRYKPLCAISGLERVPSHAQRIYAGL